MEAVQTFVRYFTDSKRGVRFLGTLLGNGGTAVRLESIRAETDRVRRGYDCRFFQPVPGVVRIRRWPESSVFDKSSAVDIPLLDLVVECKACVELREA